MASQATARDGDRRPKIIDLSDRTWQSKEFKPETPVIVRGGASDWPAFSKWDFDFFATGALGSVPVSVLPDQSDAPFVTTMKNFIAGLAHFDDKVANDKPPYLRGWRFEE